MQPRPAPHSMRIFVSYRRTSGLYAEAVMKGLAATFPGAYIYFDTTAGVPGEDFALRIRREILLADLVLVVVAPNLFTGHVGEGKVDHVVDEIESALSLGVPILPVLERSEHFPSVDSVPLRIEPFARINAAVHPRLDDQKLDAKQLAISVVAALPKFRMGAQRDWPQAVAQTAAALIQRPSRFASAGSTTRLRAFTHGLLLLLATVAFTALIGAAVENQALISIVGVAVESSILLAGLSTAFVLMSSICWLVLHCRPQLAAVFLGTCTALFAIWVLFVGQTLLDVVAIKVSGLELATVREVVRMSDLSYAGFTLQLFNAMTPGGLLILVVARVLLVVAVAFYVRDYLRFQCVLHMASKSMARKWRFGFLTLAGLSTLLLAAFPSQAAESPFLCTPNAKELGRNNLCLSFQHRSQDPNHPGNVEVKVYGSLTHTFKDLVLNIRAIEVLSDNKRVGGLIRVNRIDVVFAPFVPPAGVGTGTDVVYRWRHKAVSNGTAPIDMRLTGESSQKVELDQAITLTLPTNYDQGKKRLYFHLLMDVSLPKGGFTSAGWPAYCVYESGSCLSN